jgi:cell wall-associated NlpC family hydrolase
MTTKADRLRELLLKQVGKRYIFGHEVRLADPSPPAFDCSELVQWAFYRLGVDIPDGSSNQYSVTRPIGQPSRVGDLFFLKYSSGRVHHVGIYIGNGEIVEARSRLWGVVKTPLAKANARGAIWRRFPQADFGSLTSGIAPKPPATPPKPTGVKKPPKVLPRHLVEGMPKNVQVSSVQLKLRKLGYYKGAVDGQFGPLTKAAVLKFQKVHWPKNPQQWDGVVGPLTWAALGL